STPVSPSVHLAFHREPPLHPPECFLGDPQKTIPFLTQCRIQFRLQPSAFPMEESKVGFRYLLSGLAHEWGMAEWNSDSADCSSFDNFAVELQRAFDPAKPHSEAAHKLAKLQQDKRSVLNYSIEFRTLASSSKWDSQALTDMFYCGLSEKVMDEMAARDLPPDLNRLIEMAVRIDHRIQERNRESQQNSPTVSERSTGQEEEVFPDISKVQLPLTDVSTRCQHSKTEAIQKYLNEALAAGLIRPSSSPA
ncbi:hypothetical protein QTP70_025910, partial [Hemibagrus guttatus]